MAYTGSGTAADPYLVSTFADFKTCVAMSGAYVKVVDDINAKLEPNVNSLSYTMSFYCAKVYSDKLCRIHGFKITTNNYAFQSTSTVIIENIVLDDVVVVFSGSNTKCVLWYGTNNRTVTLSFCEINVLVEVYSNRMTISEGSVEFSDSVLKIKFSKYDNTTVSDSSLSTRYLTLTRSVLEIIDFPLTMVSTTSTSAQILNINKLEYTIVKINVTILSQLNLNKLSIVTSTLNTNNSIFVISVEGASDELSAEFSGTNFSNCIADSDVIGSATYNILDTQNIKLVTDEQVKSEEYLTNIGFIA